MDKTQISLTELAERLNLTRFDNEPIQEEYILTKEEEDAAIKHEIGRLLAHWEWKINSTGISVDENQRAVKAKRIALELNRDEILRKCNSNKQYDIWQKKQRETDYQTYIKRQEELKSVWTASKMYSLMKYTSENIYKKTFQFDGHNKEYIEALCYLLSNDDRLESKMKLSKDKGIIVRGISGLGKTYVIECVKDNLLSPIKVVSILNIHEEIRKYGEYNIGLNDRKFLYIDDVGTENGDASHYSNKINWFKEFIESNYLSKIIPFNRIIVSTNLSSEKIESRYGYRVRSRIRDMFNVIDLTGDDRRK